MIETNFAQTKIERLERLRCTKGKALMAVKGLTRPSRFVSWRFT